MIADVRRKRVLPRNIQWGPPDRRWQFASTCAVILTLLANSVVPTTGFADNAINFNMEVEVSWNEYQKVTESDTAIASGSFSDCHNNERKIFVVDIPFQQDVILNKSASSSRNCKSRSVKDRQGYGAWTELANEHTLNDYEGQLEFEIYSANDRYHYYDCRTCKVIAKVTFFGGTPTPQTQKYGPFPSSIPYTQEKQEVERFDVPVIQSEDIAIEDVQCHAKIIDNQNVNLWCERIGNDFIVYASSKIIPPVASLKLSPTSGVAPLTVKLEGSGSYDPDSTFLNYDWTASDGQYRSGSENELTWIFDKEGKHDVCLVVTDSDNLQDQKCETVVVDVCSYELKPKTFNEFGKQRGGAQVHVSASDEECTWKIESNRDWLIIGSNPYKGSQTVNFSLTNNSSTDPKPRCGNLTLAKEQSVEICQKGNQKPIADFTIDPSQGNAPLTAKLDATASTDPDGPISSYHWNHGGQLLSESNGQATILYDKEGDYTISLTVKDEEGETATQSKPIKVLPPLYTLIVKSTHNGRVKVDHVEECTPPSCTKTYPKDTLVNLKAIPSTGSIFTGWTEACRAFGNALSCQVKMTQPLSVMANFKQCDYQIEGKKTEQFNANRHQGTLKIMSPNGCQWQAESNQPDWLSIEGDSYGNGNGTIQYSVKLNPNQTVRDGTIIIKRESQTRETFSVTQAGNQPPIASFTANPLNGKAPLSVSLNATKSKDPENNRIDRYEWTSSDKQPLSGATPQITYPNAGRYTINLVVVDEYGIASTDTAQQTINVDLQTYTLTVSSIGSGTVKVNGIDCGHNCSQAYEQGASLILTAEANSDAVFSAWNGACSSNTIPTSCEVSLTQPQTVTASFTSCYKEYTVTPIDTIHYDADGGHGNMNVSAPKGCPWDAKTDKEWLTITSGFSGNGDGHITYSLDPNNDNEKREGKLILAGQTFIIIQQGREYENLVINKVGDGKGHVIGAGIDCGDDCNEQYAQDTLVILTAIPSDEAIFEAWGGPCTVNETICTVKMSQRQTVIAHFISKPLLKVIIDGTGTGHVSLEPVETRQHCYKADKVCRNAYDKNTPITLTANHAADSQFVGWNGDCSGIADTCSVSMDKTKIVTATFNRLEGGPEACFTFSYSETPLTIEAEAETRCHEDREIADYQWETSDGQSGTGQTIRLTFEKQGKYTLTLKVTDEMGEGTSTQTIIFDEQLVFVGLKPFYKLGEKLEVDLIENLEVDNRFERVDLWVAVQLPDNRFLFRVPSIKEPFSSEGKAFRSSLELEDKRHRILDFTVKPDLGGNYTLYAAYVQEGKNLIRDGFGVIKSNIARATTVLYSR
ncbi:MAG: PKD domain-containing protein [Candidatus Parabeggiatoa sp.]|nr:PKD domain-containing protein [Candidatus Parabeggiatoa sp.]